jgi:L-threonylcarbamoyladenylate synthase
MDLENIRLASSKIKVGGVVAYPTDTVYGLGCDPFNGKSIQRIKMMKGRKEKPFPILVSSLDNAGKLVYFNSAAKILIDRFWPGPLTIVLTKKPLVPDLVTLGKESVAVRLPGNIRTRKLIEFCGGFLIGTSANKTGQAPCVSAQDVESKFGDEVDVILDDGISYFKKPSTIVDLKDSSLRIVREGAISVNTIKNSIKKIKNVFRIDESC